MCLASEDFSTSLCTWDYQRCIWDSQCCESLGCTDGYCQPIDTYGDGDIFFTHLDPEFIDNPWQSIQLFGYQFRQTMFFKFVPQNSDCGGKSPFANALEGTYPAQVLFCIFLQSICTVMRHITGMARYISS